MVCFFFAAGATALFVFACAGLRLAAGLFFFADRFVLFGAFNLIRNLASFFVSFSILFTRRRIFLFRFFRFITQTPNASCRRYLAAQPFTLALLPERCHVVW